MGNARPIWLYALAASRLSSEPIFLNRHVRSHPDVIGFSNEANLRGRLGLRAGTDFVAGDNALVEAFAAASLWGHLAGDNQAMLLSSGQPFNLTDAQPDMWGEVSGGINLFNADKSASVFTKVDYTFGDNVSGLAVKAGVRVAW